MIKKRNKFSIAEKVFVFGMLIIPIVHFCVFYIGTNFNSILMSFTYNGEINTYFFKKAFNEIFMGASDGVLLVEGIKNSLIIFTMSIIVIFPLSVMFSFLLYKKIPFYKYFRIIFFLPGILSAVVLVTMYRSVMVNVISNVWQKMWNLSSKPLFFMSTDYAFKSVLVYLIWLGIAANMIIYGGAFSRIPTEVLESGKIDGVGFFKELWYLIIPLIWPTMAVILLLSVVGMFSADGPILVMTQGRYGTYTLPYWIFSQTQGTTPNFNYGSAVGLVFTFISIPIMLIVRWVLNKFDSNVEY